MATRFKQAAAVAVPTVSVILALHGRYEQAATEFDALDRARLRETEDARLLNESALVAILREQDALRGAILRQVPGTWDDASALLFHAGNAYDLIADAEGENWPEQEGEALRIAMQNLLDFMVHQNPGCTDRLGKWFGIEAQRCLFLRRRRSGHGED